MKMQILQIKVKFKTYFKGAIFINDIEISFCG